MKSSISSRRPLGIAVIGCGRISDQHLQAIAAYPDDLKLVATVDPNLAKAQAVAQAYGAAHAYTTLAEALDGDDVEAVCLCTPNAAHARQSIQALGAGRHVLVEKPMAETVADARAMAEAADAAGRVLAIGMTFRHTGPMRHLEQVRAQWGRLRAVELSQCFFWDGPQAPWWATRTPDEGLILSLFAPHALDFVQWAMRADPIHIQAMTAQHQTGWLAEDEAMISLAYPEDRLASLHLSYNSPFIVDRKVLFYEHMTARIEDSEFLWLNDQLVVTPQVAAEDVHAMTGRDVSAHFRHQMYEFVKAVRGEPTLSVLHAEGLKLTQLTQDVIAASLHGPMRRHRI